MAEKLSRRKIASYVATQLQQKDKAVLDKVAAYLIENSRTREAELIVRDVELELLKHGIAHGTISSARPLASSTKDEIEEMVRTETGAHDVALSEEIDETLIGGIKISLPDSRLDNTVQRKLNALRALKQ